MVTSFDFIRKKVWCDLSFDTRCNLGDASLTILWIDSLRRIFINSVIGRWIVGWWCDVRQLPQVDSSTWHCRQSLIWWLVFCIDCTCRILIVAYYMTFKDRIPRDLGHRWTYCTNPTLPFRNNPRHMHFQEIVPSANQLKLNSFSSIGIIL